MKVLAFLLHMLAFSQQSAAQTACINPLDGYILHSQSEHGIANAETASYNMFEEEDSKSDSDDSDDEFDPLVFPTIWELQTDKNFKTNQQIDKDQIGEICSAYLTPILSPPDEEAC